MATQEAVSAQRPPKDSKIGGPPGPDQSPLLWSWAPLACRPSLQGQSEREEA